MQCERCQGLMVEDHFIDMKTSEQPWVQAWRCVTCGNVVDSLITKHRQQHRSHVTRRVRAAHRFPQSFGTGEATD